MVSPTWNIRKGICSQDYKKKKNIDNIIENEINILTKLDHPLIWKIIEFLSTNNEYHIITDYCPNGNFHAEINSRKRFSEREASFIIYQILLAIRYCHAMGIVHRDLKPEI